MKLCIYIIVVAAFVSIHCYDNVKETETDADDGRSISSKVDNLIESSIQGNDADRWGSFLEIVKCGKEAVPYLIELLNDDDYPQHYTVIEALRCMGPDAFDAVPSLIEHFGYESENTRDAAPGAVVQISKGKEDVVLPMLADVMIDGTWEAKKAGVFAIGSLGALPDVSIPILVEQLKAENEEVKAEAAYAIAKFGQDGSDAVTALIAVLDDQSPDVRMSVAYTLGIIGEAAASAIDKLTYLADHDPDIRLHELNKCVRDVARLAIARIKGSQFLIAIIANQDEPFFNRAGAAETIGNMEPPVIEAIPVLTQALQDPKRSVRSYAAEALGRIGPAAESALDELRRMVEIDDDGGVKDTAREAIRAIEG